MNKGDSRPGAKLSAILITHNEARNIRRCLESVRWADEIVVIDQSSVDETVSLCNKYTDNVTVVAAKGYCEPDRKTAVEKAANEWLFYIDADEVVSEALKDEIACLLSSDPPCDNYYILRKNYLLGRWIKASGWHPNYVMRLFKKNRVEFSDTIHVDIKPLGRCGYLKGDILHYSYETLHDYVVKLDRYTTVLAGQAYAKGKRIKPLSGLYDFLLLPAWYFFKKLVLQKGYKDGFRGFLIAAFTFSTIFLMHAKVWEMEARSAGSA